MPETPWGSRLRSGGTRLLLDLAVVAVWIGAMTLVFRTAGWSVTLYYVVVFVGIVGYSLAIDPWTWLWGDEIEPGSEHGTERQS